MRPARPPARKTVNSDRAETANTTNHQAPDDSRAATDTNNTNAAKPDTAFMAQYYQATVTGEEISPRKKTARKA